MRFTADTTPCSYQYMITSSTSYLFTHGGYGERKNSLFLWRHNKCFVLRNPTSSNPVYAVRCSQPHDHNPYKISCT